MRKTPRELFDDYIKTEWVDQFREGGTVHLKKRDGSRYVPTQWSVKLLAKDHNAWDDAIAAWQTANDDVSTPGYEQIIVEAGPEYTWEGALIDPDRPWAKELREQHPHVLANIERDLRNRVEGGQLWVKQSEAERRRLHAEEDEAMIATLNAKRAAEGREPLTEQQAQLVRDQRRARRGH